jgi:predicted nucleotidyltransferase component of viral defense system
MAGRAGGREARTRAVIEPNVLIRQADAEGVSAVTVERDYVLAHVLAAIARRDEGGQIVFKGGTALRLCHFEAYRYSADLDFSLVDGLGLAEARELVVDSLADSQGRLELPVLRLNDASPPRIEYVGPLGRAKPRPIKLDLAHDELVEDTTTLPIISRYSDQESRDCRVYTLDEVGAEKLRCVIQQLQCRDLYDLHELLVAQDVDAQSIWPSFQRKARHRDIDPNLFASRFGEREPEWQRRWDDELAEYVTGGAPAFDGLIRAVRRELRFALR